MKKLDLEIDLLYQIRQDIGELRDQEEEVADTIKEIMEGESLNHYETKYNKALLIPTKKVTIDVVKFASKVTTNQFMECVNVGVTKAKQFLGLAIIEEISEITESSQLKITSKI